jgi:pimeloyl-ACP methyl ester carboxylesterase
VTATRSSPRHLGSPCRRTRAERHAEDLSRLPPWDADHARRRAQPRLAGLYPLLIVLARENGTRVAPVSDVAATRANLGRVHSPASLVGHSYGGAVITARASMTGWPGWCTSPPWASFPRRDPADAAEAPPGVHRALGLDLTGPAGTRVTISSDGAAITVTPRAGSAVEPRAEIASSTDDFLAWSTTRVPLAAAGRAMGARQALPWPLAPGDQLVSLVWRRRCGRSATGCGGCPGRRAA